MAHEGAKRLFSDICTHTRTLIHPHTLPHIILRTLGKCYVDVYGYDMCVLCHACLSCVAWAGHQRRERSASRLAFTAPTTHLWQFSLLSIILACSELPTSHPALHLFSRKDSGPAYIHENYLYSPPLLVRCNSLTGVHFNRQGSQMCWRCGLRIPSGEGSSAMSANREKHTGLNSTIPHGDAEVCDLPTTVKRARQSTQWQCRWLWRCLSEKRNCL